MSAEVRVVEIYEVVCVECNMFEPANGEEEAEGYVYDHNLEFHDGGVR